MLKVENLKKSYRAGWMSRRIIHAVRDVSFEIPDGGTLGIVGSSGSGKTTIARLLMAVERADGGRILLDGKPLTADRRVERRRHARSIQMVFQHPEHVLDPRKTVWASLSEPLRVHRLCTGRELNEHVLELLEQVGLSRTLLSRYPHQISGGEAQRVMIAWALALKPRILILDEPSSMLDVSVQAQIMNLFRDLQRRLGLSFLFISHDIGVVSWLCDEIAVMKDGVFVETGPTRRVLTAPQHPFSQMLLDSMKL